MHYLYRLEGTNSIYYKDAGGRTKMDYLLNYLERQNTRKNDISPRVQRDHRESSPKYGCCSYYQAAMGSSA